MIRQLDPLEILDREVRINRRERIDRMERLDRREENRIEKAQNRTE